MSHSTPSPRPPLEAAVRAAAPEEFLRGRGRRAPAMPLGPAAGGLADPPGLPPVGDRAGDVRPRRGRGVPVRRRRHWPVVLQAFAAAALLVGVPAAAGAWLLASPRFALAEIEVAPSERVSAEWIERRLDSYVGRNLVVLPLDAVGRRLDGHPWLAGASVTKELPDRLRVAVVEERPAGVLAAPDGRALYVGADGRPIAPVPRGETPPAALPRLLGAAADPPPTPAAVAGALELAREIVRLEPAWTGGRPPAIEILGPDDYRLELAALPYPLLVRRGALGPALAWWREVAPEVARRHPHLETVDLRHAGRIVVRPATASPGPSPPPPASSADAVRLEERFHAEA